MTRLVGDVCLASDINAVYSRMSYRANNGLYPSGTRSSLSAGGYLYWFMNGSAAPFYLSKRPTGLTAATHYSYPYATGSVTDATPTYATRNIAWCDGGGATAPVIYSQHKPLYVVPGVTGYSTAVPLRKWETSGATLYNQNMYTDSSVWESYFTLGSLPYGWTRQEWLVTNGRYWLGNGTYYYGIELLSRSNGDGPDNPPTKILGEYVILTKRSISTDAVVSCISLFAVDSANYPFSYSNITREIAVKLAADANYCHAYITVGADEGPQPRMMILNYPSLSVVADYEDDYAPSWLGVDPSGNKCAWLDDTTIYRAVTSTGGSIIRATYSSRYAIPDSIIGDYIFYYNGVGHQCLYISDYLGTGDAAIFNRGLWRGTKAYTPPITAGNTMLASQLATLRGLIEDEIAPMFVSSIYTPLGLFASGLYYNACNSVLYDDYGISLPASPTDWHGGDVSSGDIMQAYHLGDAYAIADYVQNLL